MLRPSPLPATGEVFLDARGGERALRVSWHPESGVAVLSLWRGGTCAGSFRLSVDEVPELVRVLRDGLDAAYDHDRVARGGLLDSVFGPAPDETGDLDRDGSLAG